MKKEFKTLLILLAALVLIPNIVNATAPTTNNWRLDCDKTKIFEGEEVTCTMSTEITDATSPDNDIQYILARISDVRAVSITNVSSPSGLDVLTTNPGETFSSSVPIPRSDTTCKASGGCYDFYNGTGVITGGGARRVIGEWKLEILPSELTSNDDCAKICLYVDTIIEGQNDAASHGQIACKEIKLNQQTYPICKCENGVCYGLNGTEVTEEKYREECLKICKCENGVCYNKNGEEVTEEKYRLDCAPVCVCEGNQCYDHDHNPVTPKEFKEICGCRIENGKYYDNNGEETIEEHYYEVCNPKCYCDDGGQCYDNNGKPVDNDEYKRKCGCRKENGKYYDNSGNEVDEATYNAKCIPDTGAVNPYLTILALIVAGYGIVVLVNYYKNNKKIYKV